MSDNLLAYDVADPPTHPHDAFHPFTNFHDHIFLVHIRQTGQYLQLSPPHLLFTTPRGQITTQWSLAQGWLVYTQYSAQDPTAPWTLVARDTTTGRVIVLDTPAREGIRSLAAQASSDGRTVVWQSYTRTASGVTSVIRSYDLRTGQRRLLLHGGSPQTFAYDWPSVSGHYAVCEKEQGMLAQILLVDLQTGQVRPLTRAGESNSEPFIAGSLVVWKEGPRYGDADAMMVADLASGRRREVAAPGVEQPKVVAGHAIIFPLNPEQVALYDVRTHRQEVLVKRQSDGTMPGNIVLAGGHMAAYSTMRFSTSAAPQPWTLTLFRLP